ncbi:MAG: hypothetical protein AAF335_03870 [Bacteroidota bacterium]
MKKKEPYTIIWEDHLAAPYIHQVQAYDQEHAFYQWGKKFKTQTIGYNLTQQEYQAIAKIYEGSKELSQEYPEDFDLVYSESKNQAFKNVWYDFMYYDLQGILDPYAYIHIIKNSTKAKKRIFTFRLRYFLGSHLIQNEAPSLEDAFTQWKEEMIEKKNLEFMPQYALQRLQRALKKQKKTHLSPIVNVQGVWRWRLLVGRAPLTLHIVPTDEPYPKKPQTPL